MQPKHVRNLPTYITQPDDPIYSVGLIFGGGRLSDFRKRSASPVGQEVRDEMNRRASEGPEGQASVSTRTVSSSPPTGNGEEG